MTETPDLNALSEAATQGEWADAGNKGRVLALFKREGGKPYFWDILSGSPLCFASDVDGVLISSTGSNETNAAYIAALVNAHRAGQLHTAADVEAAVRAEREACAKLVDGFAEAVSSRDNHRSLIPRGEGDMNATAYADAIRARGDST